MLLALQRFSRPRWPSCPRPGVSPPALQPRPGVSMPRAQCGSRGSALASACSPSSASAGLVEPASLAVAPSAGRLYAANVLCCRPFCPLPGVSMPRARCGGCESALVACLAGFSGFFLPRAQCESRGSALAAGTAPRPDDCRRQLGRGAANFIFLNVFDELYSHNSGKKH